MSHSRFMARALATVRDEAGLNLLRPIGTPELSAPVTDALDTLVFDMTVAWVSLQTRNVPSVYKALTRLEEAGLATTTLDNAEVRITMGGITGTALTAHGALNDWLSRAKGVRA